MKYKYLLFALWNVIFNEQKNLIRIIKDGIGSEMIMDNNREQEHMVLNMKDAGCSEDTIHRFLLCYQAGDIKGELRVLSIHRQALLDEVHKGQKEIDCLDYLVYQIEKGLKK